MKSRIAILLVFLGLAFLVFMLSGLSPTTAQGPAPLQAEVSDAVQHDTSPALRDMTFAQPPKRLAGEAPNLPLPKSRSTGTLQGIDPVLQEQAGALSMPSPLANFEGVDNQSTVTPPDTEGDIGYDPATGKKYYVQWVNLWFAVWDVSNPAAPVKVYPTSGFAPGNILWQGFGGYCESTNDGDPIAMFDPMANRWFMSQFALPNYPNGPFLVCIAVSQTADPTGAWYRYAYTWTAGNNQDVMNDYPKFGVWPDGYYMTVNQFYGSDPSCQGAWCGAGVAAFERSQMLNGLAARMVKFDLLHANANFGGMLPSDLDGATLPPIGAPNVFAEVDDSSSIGPVDAMRLWDFHVDWATPANSTFGLSSQPNLVLNVADFTPVCGSCVPQPDTSVQLDTLGDRLMYRLAYRNFGDHESLVVNHTVNAGSGRAGVRWYEVRRTGGTWSIYQQGTYAPSDGLYRWMGSIAMDHMGNMALGYSVSSSSVYPSIRYTGRLASDPLGQITQDEVTLIAGGGSETSGYHRWGDYSMMSVDPVDDCTFWYTTEYYPSTSSTHWHTRIGSFKFPDCNIQTQGTLTGKVSDVSTGQGIAGALVQVSSSIGQSGSATSNLQGNYAMPLFSGLYTGTASMYGYQPSTITGISITAGMTTTQNFTLTAVPSYIVSGTVTDGKAGWPLYAHVVIQGSPFNPPASAADLWNDPVTGFYSVTLAVGNTYTLTANAWATGYQSAIRTISPLTGHTTVNFGLTADGSTCNAPGYSQANLYTENFESTDGGYTHSGTLDQWQWGTPTVWPNSCASGSKCWGTNLGGNYANNANMVLTSSLISLAGVSPATPVMASWQQAYHVERSSFDQARAQVSINGGPWTTMWSNPDVTTQSGWTKMTYDVSSAAGGTARFRWMLISDSGINFEGLYVDDVTLSAGCQPAAGGLVVGNVYDANTLAPLAGAQVANARGDVATTWTTLDPAVPDSFYTLFAPMGAQVLTATLNVGYASVVTTTNVVQSNTVRQDFNLPAGRLTYTPAGLEAALQMGQSANLPLTLTNNGGLPVTFTLSEIDRGHGLQMPTFVTVPGSHRAGGSSGRAGTGAPFRYPGGDTYYDSNPLRPAAAHVLLLFSDNGDGDPLRTILSSYADIDVVNTFKAITLTPTLADLQPYDVVIVWNDYAFADPVALGNALADYLDAGGHVILSAFAWHSAGDLGGRLMSGSYSPFISAGWGTHSSQASLGRREIGHPILLGVASATDWYRNIVSLAPGADLVARWSDGEAFIATKGRVVGINSYPGYYYQWVGDMGIVWHNAINYLLAPTDVPWLSETPVSGTIASMTNQPINVSLDAGVLQTADPGNYYAQLWIQHNTPYTVSNVPVTLTVSAPPTWGKLTGQVVGLAVCDVNPTPLANSTVLVQSGAGPTWTLTTDVGGNYNLWLAASSSPFTLTASHAGYLSSAQAGITVTAQTTTTQNFALQLNVACINQMPSAFDVLLEPGRSATFPLTVTSSGAVPLNWNLTIPLMTPWLTATPMSGAGLVGSQRISVTFDASATGGPGVYVSQLQISHNAPQPTVVVPVTLTVVSYGVALNAPLPTQSGDPATTITYTLRLTNTGGTSDTFNLSKSSSLWTSDLPASVGPLAANAGIDVPVVVHIPANADAGATDVVTVTATSIGDVSQSASVALTTQANTIRALMLTPSSAALSGGPGAVVTYTLHLTNTGNLPDTFTLSLGPSAWDARLSLTTTLLAARVGVDVSVYVSIPVTVTTNMSDTVKITASGTSTSASSLLTTSAALYRIFMPLVMKSP